MKGIRSIIHELKRGDLAPDYASVLLNLLLVQLDGRRAYLMVTANLKTVTLSEIVPLLRPLGICLYLDPISVGEKEEYKPFYNKDLLVYGLPSAFSEGEYPGFWIMKPGTVKEEGIPLTDEEVGALLGMKDPGGDYFDFTRQRTSLSIVERETGAEVTAELLMGDKEENRPFAEEKANTFTEVMKKVGLPYRFRAKLEVNDGTTIRARERAQGNTRYVVEHQKEYLNDLTNILPEHHVVVRVFKRMMREKKLVKKYVPLYLSFYRLYRPDKDMLRVESVINERVAREWV